MPAEHRVCAGALVRRSSAVVAAFVALAAGCVSRGPLVPADVPGAGVLPLRSSYELEQRFALRQRLTFRWPGAGSSEGPRSGQLDVALEVGCGEVVVVLLSPFGIPVGTLRQRGTEVESGPTPPGWDLASRFPPDLVLSHVHAALLYPLSDPALRDGTHARALGECRTMCSRRSPTTRHRKA